MRFIKHAIALSAILLSVAAASGCSATRRVEFFEPTANPAIEVVAPWSGLPEVARFKFAAGALDLSVLTTDPYPRARIMLQVPEGHSIRFIDGDLVSRDAGTEATNTAKILEISSLVLEAAVRRRVNLAPDQVLLGATERVRVGISTTDVPRRFEILATFTKPLSTSFSLQLPDLDVDGQRMSLRSVLFKREIGMAYIAPAP